jgi:two-component system, cell cycle response regulator CpdR
MPNLAQYCRNRMAVSGSGAKNNIVMRPAIALVVDDEPSVRHYIGMVLRGDGIQTLEAASGTEGLHLVCELQGQLDLIVSDIQMPDGDGNWLACSVAKEYPAIPCLLVSGVEQRHASVNAGFLQKPFLPAELLQMVHRMIARGPVAGALCGSSGQS